MAVQLVPLDDEKYVEFLHRQLVETARQETLAGHWRPEEAEDRAREELAGLISGEARRTGHRFFEAVVQGTGRVGWIWEGPPPVSLGLVNTRWLYQITIDEAQRGKGLGRATLVGVEGMLRSEGVETIRLNVNRWNKVAVALYESSGYTYAYKGETDANLHKRLR